MKPDSASILLNLVIEKTVGGLSPEKQQLLDELIVSAPNPAQAARELYQIEVAAAALDFVNFPVKARDILRDRLRKSDNLMNNKEPTNNASQAGATGPDTDGSDSDYSEMPNHLRQAIIADGMAFVNRAYGSKNKSSDKAKSLSARSQSEVESKTSLGVAEDFAEESYGEFRPRGVPVGRRNSLKSAASIARTTAVHFGKLGRSVAGIPKVREVGTLVVAAAGLLALALFLRQQPEPNDIATTTQFPSMSEDSSSLIWMDDKSVNRHQRETFLTNPPSDMIRAACQPGTQAHVKGEWLWSDSQQKGFLTFSGLEVNDPNEFQYQLWIFDTKVDQKYPINSGLFNVVDQNRAVVVLRPKLRISQAVQFMVTQERPGGVVISSRDNVVAVAKTEK